jgi:NAD-dependent dihydropyrimidine dehydrogenase PreA subunit
MSKSWYPVIDYEKCNECGVCTDKCKHGVYDLKKVPTPVVINPDNCIQGCHGCGNICPSEAIEYVGDNPKSNKCCCSCDDTKDGGCC